MSKRKISIKTGNGLADSFPPSEPCQCKICLSYCRRPGWWTVKEASLALDAGYGNRMMLELSPDRIYGVLAPAFRGNECAAALQIFSGNGCCFLKENACELHGTGFQPLECRFCHHENPGNGVICHAAIGKEWKASAGQALVLKWMHLFGLTSRAPSFKT